MRKLQLYTMSNRYETFLLGKWNWRKEKNFKNEKEKKAHFTQCQRDKTWVQARKVTLATFVSLFATALFQMLPQMVCSRRCIVTLVAFVGLFSTMCFHMLPQIACLRRCIVALVAFVWILSTVRFQMCFQSACIRGYIITLAAFVWLFPSVYF